jgi:hypothetical protein
VLAFFDECGLIGAENRFLLRRAGVSRHSRAGVI